MMNQQQQQNDDAMEVVTTEEVVTTKPPFEIVRWNAVGTWAWSVCTESCAICRNELTDPSINYQTNPTSINETGLSVAFGVCGHAFHLDCIQRWLKAHDKCPICAKEWDITKIEPIPSSMAAGKAGDADTA